MSTDRLPTLTLSMFLLRPFVRYLATVAKDSELYARTMRLGARLADPEARLPAPVVTGVLWEAVLLTEDPAIGLHASTLIEPEDRGVLEYAARGQETLRGALDFTIRHYTLITDATTLTLEEEGDRALLTCRAVNEVACLSALTDYCLGALLGFIRRYTPLDESACELQVAHPCPSYAEEYRRVFRGPVRFDAGRDAIVMPRRYLDVPMPPQPSVLTRAFQLRATQLVERLAARSTAASRVRKLLERNIGSQELTMGWAAARLGVSVPTLRRRLALEGITFRELAERVRREIAERELQGARTVSDIAHRLGFSSVSAFDRAFRNWSGRLPSEYRARVTQGRDVTEG